MAGETKHIWLSSAIGAAAATIVITAVAAFAVVNWGIPKAQTYLNARLAGLDAKLAKNNNATLSAIHKLPSLENTTKEIEQLNARIQTTNATLTDIQKQISLATIKAELAPLATKLDKTNTALAAIQAGLTRAGNVRDADAAARNAALNRIEKTLGSVKDQIAGAASQTDLQNAAAKLNAVQTSLAALATAVKEGFASGATSRAALKDEVAKLAQPPESPTGAIPKKTGHDVIVFYVAAPAAAQPAHEQPQSGAIPPMSVQFERIGSIDDNGQADLIVRKLRPIVEGHKSCSITVSGHTDTLGSDEVNHALSKKRAREIADRLRGAFAGKHVQISDIAWGERQLKEWTPDDTADATNRRVDIVVRCAGA